MKILAYLGNVAFFIYLVVAAFNQDHFNGEKVMVYALFFAFPVINLIAIAGSGGRGFLSLYFERKRLEQEQKIFALKKSMGKD